MRGKTGMRAKVASCLQETMQGCQCTLINRLIDGEPAVNVAIIEMFRFFKFS